MSEDLREIDVDGLPAPVDAREYEADPAKVIQEVRDARAALLGDPAEIYGDSPDYDSLVDLADRLGIQEADDTAGEPSGDEDLAEHDDDSDVLDDGLGS